MVANDIARGVLDVKRYAVGSATILYRFANVPSWRARRFSPIQYVAEKSQARHYNKY